MESRQAEDWRRTLPGDWTAPWRGEDGREREVPLREHPALAKYGSKDEAVKALVHAQKLLGRKAPDGPVLPGPGAPDEDWGRVYAALGRPEGPEGYELPDMDLEEGFELNRDLLDEFKAKAHELGLSAGQAAGLYSWFLPRNMASVHDLREQARAARTSELESLRTQHREQAPRVLDAARQTALALGGEDLLGILDETGAGDRAAVINALARVAPLVLEGSLRHRAVPGAGALTLERLREMMRDPRYSDPSARDPEFVRRVVQGFETLYPGEYQPGPRG